MDYYKITNRDEIHNGLPYKTGLNVDIKPFNPSGDCEKGGIYFTREDVLFFLHYGEWLRRVTLLKDEPVYENPGRPKKWKAHQVILSRRRKITAKIVKKLINEGAEVNAKDDYGETPLSGVVKLSGVAKLGYPAIVEMLIEAGADVNTKDKKYHTPLHIASWFGRTEIAKFLIKSGAYVNVINIDGNTPLHYAAAYGQTEIAKLLIQAGANVNKKNKYRETPLHKAFKYRHSEIKKLLIKAGAKKYWTI